MNDIKKSVRISRRPGAQGARHLVTVVLKRGDVQVSWTVKTYGSELVKGLREADAAAHAALVQIEAELAVTP